MARLFTVSAQRIRAARRIQLLLPTIATEGDEVPISGFLVSMQSRSHASGFVNPDAPVNRPSHPNKSGWGTPTTFPTFPLALPGFAQAGLGWATRPNRRISQYSPTSGSNRLQGVPWRR
jgi:hypothetical protein